MGLFSSKKKEEIKDLPPMPPIETSSLKEEVLNKNQENIKPNFDAPNDLDLDLNKSNLPIPPIPSVSNQGLNSIKEQIIDKKEDFDSSSNINSNLNSELSQNNLEKISKDDSLVSDSEGLFDIDNLDFPKVNDENLNEENLNDEKENVLTDDNLDMSFLKKPAVKKDLEKTYFITTKDFKDLIEIIESVKNKVKQTSEIHLRLLDIKSEEDIEFENLRKNFEFIEDKLYEVDNLIFEK